MFTKGGGVLKIYVMNRSRHMKGRVQDVWFNDESESRNDLAC